MYTFLNFVAIRSKLFKLESDCSVGRFKAKSERGMLVVSILGLEFKLFIDNSLIGLSICVLVEYSGFHGANSLHKLLVDFGLFMTLFVGGFCAAKLT